MKISLKGRDTFSKNNEKIFHMREKPSTNKTKSPRNSKRLIYVSSEIKVREIVSPLFKLSQMRYVT